jgi:hypothetical protein
MQSVLLGKRWGRRDSLAASTGVGPLICAVSKIEQPCQHVTIYTPYDRAGGTQSIPLFG